MLLLIDISIVIIISHLFYVHYKVSRKFSYLKKRKCKFFLKFKNLINLFYQKYYDMNKYFTFTIIFLIFSIFFNFFFNNKIYFFFIIVILYFTCLIILNKLKKFYINKDISNIIKSLILSLSSDMNIYYSLKYAEKVIKNKEVKKEYFEFLKVYRIYNFNIEYVCDYFKNNSKICYLNELLYVLEQNKNIINFEVLINNLNKYLSFTKK